MTLKIIFEDKDILVLEKPARMVVDKSETQQGPTLQGWIAEKYESKLERSGIVHRLDKDTSGVILVAKTQAALESLQAQFKERKTKKEYLALVHGKIREIGVIRGNIGRNPVKRERFSVLEGNGKEAVTEYEPVEQLKVKSEKLKIWFPEFNNIQMRKLERQNYGEFTLLKCYPLTGRTHQIRVHLKYIQHPIVSDGTYVGRKIYRLDKRWCPRMFLHARKLGFCHPKTGEWMEVESELAEDLKEALNKLKS